MERNFAKGIFWGLILVTPFWALVMWLVLR